MNSRERRATLSLAALFAFRMLGLFMILPVFSIYTKGLSGTTPILMGLALGIYGLTQAGLQIPFGMLSDRIGRKPIILLGLALFALGSVVAALSHSVYGVIFGRGIQGAGAIGSTTLALLADLTSEKNRTKAMALIGMAIGASFTLGMILGPILNAWIHVNGIFWFTACLASLGIVILYTAVPKPREEHFQRDVEVTPNLFKTVLSDPHLLQLDIGIFLLHAILTANFVVIPIVLHHIINIGSQEQWYVYLPVMIFAFLAMVPCMLFAEKKQKQQEVFLGAILILGIAEVLLIYTHSQLWGIISALFIFFTGFSLLEATLPSMISKASPQGSKGTALGVYSSCQFLGIFTGGTLGGWLYGHHHVSGVFIMCAFLGFAGLLVFPPFCCCNTNGSDGIAVGHVTNFWICA